jgi:TRAP-type C4-dicarboxylate transport system substrate-binding protein
MLMGHASLNNTASYVSAMNLKNLPLLIQNTETARNLFQSDTWREYVDPSYREAKLEPIGNEYVLDFRHIGVNPDVTENGWRTPDQSEGIEIRVAGSTIVKRAFEEVGASTVNVAWTETPQSMQEGVFDAVHISRLAHCSYGFGEFEEYVTGPNIANAGHTLVMNKEYFDGLDKTYQEIIKEGGQTASQKERELRNSAMEDAISCIEEGGADYIELSSDERSQWADAVGYKKPLWDDMIEQFGFTREDVDALAEAAGTA